MGPEQAQEVMRRLSRMVGVEPIEKRQHVVGMRPDQFAQQRLDSRLFFCT